MLLDGLLDSVLFEGTATSSLVPRPYTVAFDGRPYVVDFSFTPYRRDAFRHRSIPFLRAQSDTSNITGEQSINPQGLWRRSVESWHAGSGQMYLDRSDSDVNRFHTSKGVNPWTRWQLTLLNDTALRRASANTNLACVPVGSYLYAIDGTALVYTQDMTVGSPTFTTVTGPAAQTATSIASDGFNVWVAYNGTNGLYTTTRGAAAATQLVTSTLGLSSLVRYVKGRLIVANANSVYNVTSAAPAALPTALLTHSNTDFVWVDATEGPANIYLAGYSGDKSLIYRTQVKADGTALDVPQIAGELPDGEIVRTIQGYLGYLLIGTDTGFRTAAIDTNGNLNIGARVATTSAVKCFEPQDRFVWYGLTNYDSTSTGLGRLDLTVFNDTAPAYATDLLATAQGTVTSVCTFQNNRVFAISGSGLWTSTTDLVASGTLDSGQMGFGISDDKVAVTLATTCAPLVGSYSALLSQDSGAFTTIGSNITTGTTTAEFPTSQALTLLFEVRTTLNRATDTTTGPTFYRQTLLANPAAATGYIISVPIRLHETVLVGDTEVNLVPSVELSALDSIRVSKRVITYQEGSATYKGTIDDIDWLPDSIGRSGDELNGVCVVFFKTL